MKTRIRKEKKTKNEHKCNTDKQDIIKSQTKNKRNESIQPKGGSLKRTTKWKV